MKASGQTAHFLNALGSALQPLSALAVAPMVARGLGVEDRGYFAADQALILISASLIGLGLSDAASVSWRAWSNRLRFALTLGGIGISVAIALAGTLSAATPMPRAALLVLGAGGFFLALEGRGFALAHGNIGALAVEKIASGLLRVLATAVFFVSSNLTVETALVSLILPQALGAIALFTGRVGGAHASTQVSVPPPRRLVFWSVIGGIGGVLVVNLDSVYLISLIGAQALGLYAVAILVAELFTAAAKPFRDAVFSIQGPAKSKYAKLHFRCLGLLSVGAALCIVLLPWLIPLVFGKEFGSAVPAAICMAIGGVAKGWAYLANGILVREGELGARTFSTYIGLVVSVAAIFPLIPFGALGAAIAKSLGYVAMASISAWGIHRRPEVR